MRAILRAIFIAALALLAGSPALAQTCKQDGSLVTCDDGRQGVFEGNAILWPDGTRSRPAPHESVVIGHKQSVRVGQGVFVGQGKGVVPLDDPNAPNKIRCAVLNGVSYCH